jgi:hypothetical protein
MGHHRAWLFAQRVRFHRIMVATKLHLPKWLLVVIAIALAIPGPQDELAVALIIGAWAAFRPAMRDDMRFAWSSIYAREGWVLDAR